jgi:hypothetical protein
MKNYACALPLLLVSLLWAPGCTKSVRYSQDEIKDFPPQVQEYIKDRRGAVGMTKMQVRYSWGSPHTVTVLSPSSDSKERVQWTYNKMIYFKSHLIFTDDRLTEIISD